MDQDLVDEKDYVEKQIDAKIIEINNNDNIYEIGTVVNVRDFIVEVTGINNVMFYEKINIANKAMGYVNSINENSVTVAVLRIDSPINVGDIVYSTNVLYQGNYSPSSMGRVIDLFGNDKLSGKKYSDLIEVPIERKTIPIMDRGVVKRPLLTGITGIDLMYPIGRGQRQLIIGDKRTGKTQIGLDTIVNQKGQNVICFYVAIGKTKKEVKNIYSELLKKGALEYTTIFTAFNDELPPVISLVPYFALSVAENYMMEGKDVLVIIDDLKRHAEAYREISLISGKTPGRDAYPADIFYTHSRLLEKGCQHKNGGSVTILPIVETKGGDITDYISTNIISITDGQIVLSEKAFQKGEKPAIDYGLSVSRLGGAVQRKDMKIVGTAVRRKLLSYLETRSVYELVNMDEMSFELKNQFMEGKIILDNMMQYKFSPRSPEEMMDLFVGFVENEEELEEATNSIKAEDVTPTIDNSSMMADATPVEGTDTMVVDYTQGEVPTIDPIADPIAGLNQMPEEIPNEVSSEEVSNVVNEEFDIPAVVETPVADEVSSEEVSDVVNAEYTEGNSGIYDVLDTNEVSSEEVSDVVNEDYTSNDNLEGYEAPVTNEVSSEEVSNVVNEEYTGNDNSAGYEAPVTNEISSEEVASNVVSNYDSTPQEEYVYDQSNYQQLTNQEVSDVVNQEQVYSQETPAYEDMAQDVVNGEETSENVVPALDITPLDDTPIFESAEENYQSPGDAPENPEIVEGNGPLQIFALDDTPSMVSDNVQISESPEESPVAEESSVDMPIIADSGEIVPDTYNVEDNNIGQIEEPPELATANTYDAATYASPETPVYNTEVPTEVPVTEYTEPVVPNIYSENANNNYQIDEDTVSLGNVQGSDSVYEEDTSSFDYGSNQSDQFDPTNVSFATSTAYSTEGYDPTNVGYNTEVVPNYSDTAVTDVNGYDTTNANYSTEVAPTYSDTAVTDVGGYDTTNVGYSTEVAPTYSDTTVTDVGGYDQTNANYMVNNYTSYENQAVGEGEEVI